MTPKTCLRTAKDGSIHSDKCPLTNCTFKGVTKGLNRFENFFGLAINHIAYELSAKSHCPEPCAWYRREVDET